MTARPAGVTLGHVGSRTATTDGRFAMTAPAPPRGDPRSDFAILDRLIGEALAQLREARTRASRVGSRKNLDLQARAEEHLNALLEYRHAAQRR
jgi:hypothetical protein